MGAHRGGVRLQQRRLPCSAKQTPTDHEKGIREKRDGPLHFRHSSPTQSLAPVSCKGGDLEYTKVTPSPASVHGWSLQLNQDLLIHS